MTHRIRLRDVKHGLPRRGARVLVDWINDELARDEAQKLLTTSQIRRIHDASGRKAFH